MADPPPPSELKASLRAEARRARREFVEALGAERLALERGLASRFRDLNAGATIAVYRARGAEIDPEPLAQALRDRGHRVALPRMMPGESGLEFHLWTSEQPLVPGAYGIEEPAPEAPEALPDLICMPLIAFDRRGGRLGQGGGFYDRTLPALPHAMRVGLAWSVQEVDAVPAEPWDVPLHAVLTEREWIPCR